MAISTPAELAAARAKLLSQGPAGKTDVQAMTTYLRLVRELAVSDPENVAEFGSIILTKYPNEVSADERWQLHEDVAVACFSCGAVAAGAKFTAALGRKFPGSTRVALLRGMALEVQSEWDDAAAVYSAILAEHPSHGDALKRMVALELGRGNTAAAIDAGVRYLDAFQADAAAWDQLARVYLVAGQLEQASFCLEETLLHAPADVTTLLRLADVLYGLGGPARLAAARGYYAKVVELSKGGNLRALYGVLGALSAQRGAAGGASSAGGTELCELVAAQLQALYKAQAPDKLPLVNAVLEAHGLAEADA